MADRDSVIKCLKSVTHALAQYKATPTGDDRLLQPTIERVETLVQVTSSSQSISQLSSSSLPALDCLSAIVTIVTDPVSPVKLLASCLRVFRNLSASQEIRHVFQGALQITAILTGVLQRIDDSSLHRTCLTTLQAVTYNAAFTAADGYIEQLVRLIMPHILSPCTELTVPSLAILANITRKSVSVQAYVKSLPNCRALLRTLISCLSHSDVSLIVCSLAPLTNLCLHEELGTKLFNNKNVDQSFQLIFSLLTDDTGPMVIIYAVDLFCDLLTSPSIAQSLVQYASLSSSLTRVVSRLEHGPVEVTCKLLELLCSLFTMPGMTTVRHQLCHIILSADTTTSDAAQGMSMQAEETQQRQHQHSFLTVLQCATNTDHHTALQAWTLVMHIFKASQEQDSVAAILPHFTLLMRAVGTPLTQLTNVQLWNSDDSETMLSQLCLQAVAVLELLTCLVDELQFSSKVSQHITADVCARLLEQQLTNNPGICGAMSVTGEVRDALSANPPDHWSMAGVQVALLTLQLMSRLNKHSTQTEVQFQRVLRDVRLFPFLATSLKSEKKQHVHRGLSVLVAACHQADHGDMARLADVVANLNVTRHRHGSSSSSSLTPNAHPYLGAMPMPSQTVASASSVHSTAAMTSAFDRHCVAAPAAAVGVRTGTRDVVGGLVMSPLHAQSQSCEVQALIERMQNGFDLKDIRAHEIMELYEHELSTRNTKETHLQDLLEAKTMALSQADRLIAQYRCRRAQSESECSKLRSLLQECEKRSAKQQLELQTLVTTQQGLQEEISRLQLDSQQLERLTDEHQQLRVLHDEQKHKLDGTVRSLAAAQEEQSSLTDLLDMQRKHCDKLKAQFESSNNQLEALERQHQQVVQQLSDKEMQCNELQHSLQRCEKLLAGREQDCGRLHNEVQETRADLTRAEEAKHQLARQVAALEEDSTHVKRRLERAENELEKHRKLRAMIHDLSGGTSGSQPASQAM